MRKIGETDFGAGPGEEGGKRHPAVAERLGSKGMVA